MKRFLAFLLAALMLCSLAACAKEETETDGGEKVVAGVEDMELKDGEDTFVYEANDSGKYDIVGFYSTNNAPHAIEIPAEIDNIDVTGIAKEAFKAVNQISEVSIPDSVESIGDYAFYSCQYLTKVTMANSVEEMGKGVFRACIALTDVTLSENLVELPVYTFMDCAALASVTIPEKIATIGAYSFGNCVALTEITVPAAVKEIGDAAFNGCSALAKATVPNTVETLGAEIFGSCAEGFTLMGEINSESALYAYANNLGYGMEATKE